MNIRVATVFVYCFSLSCLLAPAAFSQSQSLQARHETRTKSETQVDANSSQALPVYNVVFAHNPGAGKYNGLFSHPGEVWNHVALGTTAIDYTRNSDASTSPARLRISQHDGEWAIGNRRDVFGTYIYHNCRCVDLSVRVLDFPAGKYEAYVFAHGDHEDQNAMIEVLVGGKSIAKKPTGKYENTDFRHDAYVEGVHYVRFPIRVKDGQEIEFVSHRDRSNYSMFNAIQIRQR